MNKQAIVRIFVCLFVCFVFLFFGGGGPNSDFLKINMDKMNEVSVRTTNPCEPKAKASGCSKYHVTLGSA